LFFSALYPRPIGRGFTAHFANSLAFTVSRYLIASSNVGKRFLIFTVLDKTGVKRNGIHEVLSQPSFSMLVKSGFLQYSKKNRIVLSIGDIARFCHETIPFKTILIIPRQKDGDED
jgi:hypothetical protein